MDKEIVIFGAGLHSGVIIDIVEQSKEYSILGLICNINPQGSIVHGYKVLGDDTILKEIMNKVYGGIVAIGDNWKRSQVVSRVKYVNPCFRFVSVIHPATILGKKVKIGDGSVIMPGVIINSHTSIGEHCIINTRSSIDHNCIIEDFSSMGPGATLGGNVKIGMCSAISLGANIIHSKIVGEHTVVGAGATVISNIDSNVVAYGVPAKIIRNRLIGEKYL